MKNSNKNNCLSFMCATAVQLHCVWMHQLTERVVQQMIRLNLRVKRVKGQGRPSGTDTEEEDEQVGKCRNKDELIRLD